MTKEQKEKYKEQIADLLEHMKDQLQEAIDEDRLVEWGCEAAMASYERDGFVVRVPTGAMDWSLKMAGVSDEEAIRQSKESQ